MDSECSLLFDISLVLEVKGFDVLTLIVFSKTKLRET